MSYSKMYRTMSNNPHCFGTGHNKPRPDDKKVKLDPSKDPLGDDWQPPKEPKPKSYPGPDSRVPPVFRPGTGPYNPRGNQFPGAGKKKKHVQINRPPARPQVPTSASPIGGNRFLRMQQSKTFKRR